MTMYGGGCHYDEFLTVYIKVDGASPRVYDHAKSPDFDGVG
ncbi:MAG: hypothetical protein R3E97_15265 [Candidatus Eisenbacteria bacterium]